MALAPPVAVEAVTITKVQALVAEVDPILLAAADTVLVLQAASGSIGVNHDPRTTGPNHQINLEADQSPEEESDLISIQRHHLFHHADLISRLIITKKKKCLVGPGAGASLKPLKAVAITSQMIILRGQPPQKHEEERTNRKPLKKHHPPTVVNPIINYNNIQNNPRGPSILLSMKKAMEHLRSPAKDSLQPLPLPPPAFLTVNSKRIPLHQI